MVRKYRMGDMMGREDSRKQDPEQIGEGLLTDPPEGQADDRDAELRRG
jgi:hypothetical protein